MAVERGNGANDLIRMVDERAEALSEGDGWMWMRRWCGGERWKEQVDAWREVGAMRERSKARTGRRRVSCEAMKREVGDGMQRGDGMKDRGVQG